MEEKGKSQFGWVTLLAVAGAVVVTAWALRRRQAGDSPVTELFDNAEKALKKLDDRIQDWVVA